MLFLLFISSVILGKLFNFFEFRLLICKLVKMNLRMLFFFYIVFLVWGIMVKVSLGLIVMCMIVCGISEGYYFVIGIWFYYGVFVCNYIVYSFVLIFKGIYLGEVMYLIVVFSIFWYG